MSSNTQLLFHDRNGQVFSDPSAPSYTVRFKTTNSTKKVDRASLSNYVSEIIVNDKNAVTVGDATVNDSVSIRIRTSGSDLSQDRIKAILLSIGTQLEAWTNENVLLGFEPSTVPVNPA